MDELPDDEQEVLDLICQAHMLCADLVQRNLPPDVLPQVQRLFLETRRWVEHVTIH